MSIIKLMNPNDVPFGMLSNHSILPILIDGQEYKTVTNYIYSNMLTTPIYKNAVRNMPINFDSTNVNKNLLKTIDFLIKTRENESASSRPSKPINFVRKRRGQDEQDDEQDHEQDDEEKIKDYLKEFEDSKRDDDIELQKQIKRNQEIVAREIGLPFKELDLKTLRRQIEDESIIVRMKIQDAYLSYHTKEIENTIKKALEKAFSALFEDLELAELLIQTGTVPIKYESSDTMLGTGEIGNGLNLVGKVLEQLRHVFQLNRKEKLAIKKNERMYTIYRAYLILVDMMLNRQKNILEYENLNADDIFLRYSADKENQYVKIPVKERFYNDVESGFIVLNSVVLNALNNEKNLVRGVYRENIRTLRYKQLSKKDDIIFQTYLEHMVVRNFENIEADKIETAIDQQLKKLSEDELKNLKERIIKLNNAGAFSDSLKEKIQLAFNKLNIISEEELLRIENEPVEVNQEEEEEEDEEEEEEEEEERKTLSLEDAFREVKDVKEKKKVKPKEVTNDKIVKIVSQLVNISGNPTITYANMSLSRLQKELKRLQNFDLNVERKDDEFYRVPTGHGLVIYKENSGKNLNAFLPFCPDFFIKMLNIESLSFPTVEHFVVAYLISNFTGQNRTIDNEGQVIINKGISLRDARIKILSNSGQEVIKQINHRSLRPEDFTTIEHCQYVFVNEKNLSDESQLGLLTNRALDAKFENEDMQNLLLTTEDAELLWMSPDNFFLGAGNETQKGRNYVGNSLMERRARILETRRKKPEYKRTYTIKDIFDYLEGDQVLKQWVKFRTLEMCKLVSNFERLLGFNSNHREYVKFVDVVINTIYKKLTPKPKASLTAPTFVKTIINGCEGMDPSGDLILVDDEIKSLLKENEELLKQKRLISSKEEVEAFRAVQLEDLNNFKESISKLPPNIREKNLKQFVKVQLKEHEEYVSAIKKNENELEQQIQNNKDYIKDIEKKHISQKRELSIKVNLISDIYWNKLVLIAEDNVKNSKLSKDQIRLSIIRTYLPSFQTCKNIIQNPRLNCSVSAVLNILEGIKELKKKFPEQFDNNELDELDVETAISILTKSDIKDSIKVKKILKKAKFGMDYSDVEESDDDEKELPAEAIFDQNDREIEDDENEIDLDKGEENIIIKPSPQFEFKNENTEHPLINSFCPIENQKNQCYMNASIQLLFSISSLRNTLKEVDMNTLKESGCPEDTFLIIGALKSLFEVFEQNLGSDTVIDFDEIRFEDKTVYKILLGKLRAKRQEDPAEFLFSSILTKIQFLYKNELIKKLLETLSFKENDLIECGEEKIVKKRDIYSLDKFSLVLNLKINFKKPQKTIEDVIKYYQEYESIEGARAEVCESEKNPKGFFNRKRLEIEILPTTEYLILNLARNIYDLKKDKTLKNSETIRNYNVITVNQTSFLLVGCISHIGKSATSGHYVYSVFKNGKIVFTLDDSKKTHDITESFIADNGFVFLYKKIPSGFTKEDYEETDINNIRNELLLIDNELSSEKAEMLANIIFEKIQGLEYSRGKLRRSTINFFATKN